MTILQQEGRRQMILLTTYLLFGGNLVLAIGLAPRIEQPTVASVFTWFIEQNIVVLILVNVLLMLVAALALLGLHFLTAIGSDMNSTIAAAITEGILGGLFAGALIFLVNNLSLLFYGRSIF